jgi:C-terminal peptidase prc
MSLHRLYQALIICLGLAIVHVFPLAAQADGKSYAVIVGIGNYKDANLQSRPQLDQDAAALYDLLTTGANGKLYTPDQVKLYLSKIPADNKANAQLATRENLINAMEWVTKQAKEDDTVVIYWAGSGAPLDKGTCYFAVDSTLNDRNKNAVSAGDLETELDKLKTGKVAVFLDINFRGFVPNPKVVSSEDGLDNRFQEFTGKKKSNAPVEEEDDEVEAALKGRVVISCTSGLVAAPILNGKNVFTTILTEAFNGKADKEGDDADGLVTIDEVSKYFSEEYLKRVNSDQREVFPLIFGKSLHFTVALNAPALEKAIQNNKKFEAKAQSAHLGADVIKEGESYITHMPRQESERKLRKKYLEFTEGKLPADQLVNARNEMLADLKITRPDAEKYADAVMRVIRFTRDYYVKPVKVDEMAVNAVKGLYRLADEKMPAEVKERVDHFKSTDETQIKALLADVRQELGNKDAIKISEKDGVRADKGLDRSLRYMLTTLDHHTTWFNQEEYDELIRNTAKEFIGVGIQIRKDFQRDLVKVATPILGSPAYRAGIKTGDLIVKIINEVDPEGNPLDKPETTDTKGLTTQDVVKKILGKRNTKVTLVIEREEADGPKTIEFKLTRGRIEAETVFGVKRQDDDSWDYYLDKDRKIVYIRLNQFGAKSGRDMREVIKHYQKTGMNGLILDLRFNPGGYLPTAEDICNIFIEDGVLVSVKPRDKRLSQESRAEPRKTIAADVPLVVLINGGSASASEIVSACIQDHERGIVLGERSYGKGSVQQIRNMDLGYGPGAIKITMAAFFGPSGKNLNKFPNSKDEDDWGVKPAPEYTVKLSPTERNELDEYLTKHESIPRRDNPKMETQKTFVDRQLDAALDILRKQTSPKTGQK